MQLSVLRFAASGAVVVALVGAGVMPSAHAVVVLGNLGADGTTGALSTTNTGITSSEKAAQVFTTPASSPDLQLSSITLGAFTSVTPAPLALQVFTGTLTAPGALFATSTNSLTLTTDTNGTLYTWNFANVQMDPSTTYWIVPPTGLNWNFRSDFSSPTAQNSSGYVFVGGFISNNGGTSYSSGSPFYAVSVQAVPEPSTFALVAAAFGLGLCTLARRRRA